MSVAGRLYAAFEHADGTPALFSLFALPVEALAARFVNMPRPANDPHFFGPLV